MNSDHWLNLLFTISVCAFSQIYNLVQFKMELTKYTFINRWLCIFYLGVTSSRSRDCDFKFHEWFLNLYHVYAYDSVHIIEFKQNVYHRIWINIFIIKYEIMKWGLCDEEPKLLRYKILPDLTHASTTTNPNSMITSLFPHFKSIFSNYLNSNFTFLFMNVPSPPFPAFLAP